MIKIKLGSKIVTDSSLPYIIAEIGVNHECSLSKSKKLSGLPIPAKAKSFFDLKKFNSDSAITYHLISEALRRGHNNRSHFVGDPDYFDVPVNQLLSKERTIELAKTIDIKKATKSTVVKPLELIKESRDTTHYSIIDKMGNAVSNTYTLGYSFGSGVTILSLIHI